MSRGINKVILIGNLGADPEVRNLANGDVVANLSIATSESWKDKTTGEQKEQTEWHRLVAFRRLGEICGEYLKKGSKIYCEGKLQTRKWQDQSGADRYSTEIVINEMQMLDSRDASVSPSQPQQGGYQQQPQQQQPQGGYTNQQQPNPQAHGGYANQGQQPMNQQQPNPQQWQGQQQGMNHQQGQQRQGFAPQQQQNQSPAPNNNFDNSIPF